MGLPEEADTRRVAPVGSRDRGRAWEQWRRRAWRGAAGRVRRQRRPLPGHRCHILSGTFPASEAPCTGAAARVPLWSVLPAARCGAAPSDSP